MKAVSNQGGLRSDAALEAFRGRDEGKRAPPKKQLSYMFFICSKLANGTY